MERLGKYVLLAELGAGEIANVYVAVARGATNQLVALKRLRASLADQPEFVAMLVDEARVAARLDHPNVVRTIEIGEADGQYFIAMEYLQGQPLRRMLRGKNALPPNMVLAVLARALDGLEHAHTMSDYDGTPLRLVHRDVTPSNIIVTYDGAVKVLDFGIARAVGRVAETRVGFIKGKPGYMAPESARREEVDRRADIFSAGIILWEAVTGRRMWKDASDGEVVSRLVRNDVPVSPRAVNPNVPEALDEICRRALAPAPADRFPNAAAMSAAIEQWLRSTGQSVTPHQLGSLVANAFAASRAKMQAVIDAQVASALLEGEPGLNPDASGEIVPPRSSSGASGNAGTASPSPSSSPMSVTGPTALGAKPKLKPKLDPHGPTWKSPVLDLSARARTQRIYAAAAAAIVVAVLAGAFVVARRRRAAERARSALVVDAGAGAGLAAGTPAGTPTGVDVIAAATTAVAAGGGDAGAASAPDAVLRKVHVSLVAEPTSARFHLDDGPSLGNPYTADLPADTKPHVVSVDAPSYTPLRKVVALTADVNVHVSLARQPKPPSHKRPRRNAH